MLVYEEFKIEVMKQVQAALGKDVKLETIQVQQYNGIEQEGIYTNREQVFSPVIYLHGYYEQYQYDNVDIADVVKHILLVFEDEPIVDPDSFADFVDFDSVKEHLRFKVVNRERSAKFLESTAFLPFLDLAIVFYVVINSTKEGMITMAVQSEHLDGWGVTLDELKTVAFAACQRELPAVIKTMDDVMRELAKANLGKEYSDELMDVLLQKRDDQKDLYVLSNEVGLNGSACMLYKNVLKEFADKVEADLVILPSSVHECLLLADGDWVEYDLLREMVLTINETEVPDDAYLSDQIYRYDRAADWLSIILPDET